MVIQSAFDLYLHMCHVYNLLVHVRSSLCQRKGCQHEVTENVVQNVLSTDKLINSNKNESSITLT